jgi:hypothetical protein
VNDEAFMVAGAAINAASNAAQEEILAYAQQFEKREDYRPLEQLAQRVQHAVVRVAFERLNDPKCGA